MVFTKKDVQAVLREFTIISTCLTGRRVQVRQDECGELGYSTKDFVICLSFAHSIYNKMSRQEAFVFLQGVFAHELLHLLITNFSQYIPAILRRPTKSEQEIFSTFLNIAEDGAIEYFAPEYLSKEYVRALEFMRSTLYENANVITEEDAPLAQFLTAILQFRFFGFLKSPILNKEAQIVFYKSLPLLGKCFEQPVQRKRIELVNEIFELARPLWEPQVNANEMAQKMLEQLIGDLLKRYHVSKNNGSGTGSDDSNPESGESSSLAKRRITFKKVSAEEYERIMKEQNETAGTTLPDGDITVLIPDKPVPTDKKDSAASAPIPGAAGEQSDKMDEKDTKSSGAGNSSDADESESEDGKDSASSTEPAKRENSDSKNESSDGGKSDSTDTSCESEDHDSSAKNSEGASSTSKHAPEMDGTYDMDSSSQDNTYSPDDIHSSEATDKWSPTEATESPSDYEYSREGMESELNEEVQLTEKELQAIQEVNKQFEAAVERQNSERTDSLDETQFDLNVTDGYNKVCKAARCKNIVVRCDNSSGTISLYNAVVQQMSGGIKSLTNQLSRILRNRREEKMYRYDGKVSMKRLNSGRVTSRVFTKRRLPESSDLVVAVAIDISGSMGGSKIAIAQKSAIALAEVFGNLGIPIYMFGFTADMSGYDVNHFHYINWSNRKQDRYRLLSIKAESNNFDGYSIRYATELLRRKDADKKLLLVISDGNPAANSYRYVSGTQDVQLAINEANRVATTVGILLGGTNPKYHRQMYGYNFIHCERIGDLFVQLSKIIKKYI